MGPSSQSNELVEIYHAASEGEARKIVDVVLRPEGVEAVVHDRFDHAFPAPDSQPGGWFVAVPIEQRDQALRVLGEARDSGYLDGEGEIIEAPGR